MPRISSLPATVGAGVRAHGRTLDGVHMCPKSAATPGVLTMSNRDRWPTRSEPLSSRERGWPMPPAAPSTATLNCCQQCKKSARERCGTAARRQAPSEPCQRRWQKCEQRGQCRWTAAGAWRPAWFSVRSKSKDRVLRDARPHAQIKHRFLCLARPLGEHWRRQNVIFPTAPTSFHSRPPLCVLVSFPPPSSVLPTRHSPWHLPLATVCSSSASA